MKVKSSAKDLFNSLNKSINSNEINEIIVATDSDREGECIWRYIAKMSNNCKPCKRLWCDAFTEKGIEKAYSKMLPSYNYDGVANAGYGRMTSDFLMGALLTAKATIDLSSGKDIVTVGRVQTTVLAEIVRVENLLKNFKKQKSYQIVGKFRTNKGEVYEGVYEEKFDSIDKANKVIDKLKGNRAIVNSVQKELEKKWCPPLFDQTSLAIELSTKYNMSPDETLRASQSMYEKGYQTYPRTASRYITDGDTADFDKMIKSIAKLEPLALKHPFIRTNKRIVDDKKVESHGAIVPTESIPVLNNLSINEKRAYTEVMLRAIAVNFPASIDEKCLVLTGINDIIFRATGKVEIENGYREVYAIEGPNNPLPTLNKNDQVEVISLAYKEVETQPPKRYTNASILKFMETCGKNIEDEEARELIKNKGIGTAATRAEIMNKLINTGYIEVKGKTIYPTEKGMKMIEIFPVDEMKNPEFTGNLEFKLYQVEKGELSIKEYMDYIETVYSFACNKIEAAKNNKIVSEDVDKLGNCPCCKEGYITHKKGKTKLGKSYDFYGCSNWQGGCKFSISEICGKKLTEKQIQQLLSKGETGKIKGFKKKDGTDLPSAKVVIKDMKVVLDWNC